jgi:hypothetical protein
MATMKHFFNPVERKCGLKMYALRYDGFIQHIIYDNLEDAKKAYKRDVKNTLLYEYDCAVVEVEVFTSGKVKTIRTLSFEELK